MVSKKEKYLTSAQKLIERGQLDKALAEFAKVIQEDPKDTRTLLKMAELHAKRGASAEASEIYLRTGDLYAEQGFAQKAVAVYKNVLKLSPGTVPAHLKVAAMFNQLGLVSDATQQFEAAAAALQKGDRLADAVAALRQAIDIQPDNPVLRVKLAESASQAGLVDEAVREFGKAAEQLKALGRTDDALRVMERLLFHQPDNAAKARELAEAYIAKGTPRLALPKLQAALNGDPREPRTLSLLARALEQLGQVPKAISVLKELVRLCDELGRFTERDAAVLRGLTLDPGDEELRAAAARNQLRGLVAEAADEATPPPFMVQDSTGGAGGGGGSFDLSGVVRASVTGVGMSGRVVAAVGVGEGSSRPQVSGVSLSAGPDPVRILAEADVFVKYGLLERAADHLARIFEFQAEHREAREKLIVVLRRLGRNADAARHEEILAEQLAKTPPPVDSEGDGGPGAAYGISLNADSGPQQAPLDVQAGSGPSVSLAIDSADDAGDPAANMATPPPTMKSSGPPPYNDPGVFDGDVRTGDLFEVSLTASGIQKVDHAPEHHVHDDDEDRQDTPQLVRRRPVVVPSAHSFEGQTPGSGSALASDDHDDEDPVTAFSEDVPTITADPDKLPSGVAEHNEHNDDELVAELEQASFFIDQEMFDEARTLLDDLEARFPGDAGIAAHFRELKKAEAAVTSPVRVVTPVTPSARPRVSEPLGEAREANRHQRRPTFAERPRSVDSTPLPRAVMQRGGVSDSSTHTDLGIAYKGMGLFDAAINELKLACEDPNREVFALTTMGECYEAKGTLTEAIIRYKRALNCENITPEEMLVLYFLLGAAFERLDDVSEALYFFEKVLKRDPKFRDVDLKVAELKPRLVKKAR